MGIGYGGASYSYLLAPGFWLAGPSTFVMDVFAYCHGLVLLGTGYVVARRLFEAPAALFALAVLAVPPLYLAQWSLNGTIGHPQVLVFGNLFLAGTQSLFFRQFGRKRTLIGLGLLVGVGWWTSPAMVFYLVPFGLLALRTGLLWRPRIGLFVLGAVVGSLPQWIYEIHYFPSARYALMHAGTEAPFTVPDRLWAVTASFPRMFGLPDGLAPPVFALGVVLVVMPWVGAVVRAATRDRAELAWLFGFGGRPQSGRSILWLLVAANLAGVLASSRPTSPWYVLFTYSALPCWMGEFLAWLARWRRTLATSVLTGLLTFNLWTNWADTVGRIPPANRRWRPLERTLAPTLAALQARGVTETYSLMEGLPEFELTFLTGGRIAFADPWRNEVAAHSDRVDAALNPPFLLSSGLTEVAHLRESLAGLAMTVREHRAGRAALLEATPAFSGGFESLDPEGWTVTASENAAQAINLVDRDVSTGWGTVSPKRPGEWVAVDLGREQEIVRVDLLSLDWQDVPTGYRVETSRDGARWREVAAVPAYWGPLFFSEHHPFLRVRRGRVQAIFAPVRARYLRIVQTGSDDDNAWMARELFVYRPGRPRPPAPPAGALGAALAREGVWFAYANHWLSARVLAESRGQIGALRSNLFLNPQGGHTSPDPRQTGPSRLTRGVGILVGSDTNPEVLRETLREASVRWRETTAGPYPLFVVTEQAPRPRRLRQHWLLAKAGSLAVDFGAVRRVSQIEIRPGTEGPDARDFIVEGSTDGGEWTTLGPLRWAGSLYWDGAEFLRDSSRAWRVSFPPAEVRYLRVTPSPGVEAVGRGRKLYCFE